MTAVRYALIVAEGDRSRELTGKMAFPWNSNCFLPILGGTGKRASRGRSTHVPAFDIPKTLKFFRMALEYWTFKTRERYTPRLAIREEIYTCSLSVHFNR